ncbi:RNA polymerase ecf-type sigma factor [Paenibacillus riograndensis SBR5]|uniref:RNA polymerase ecf-type sigma factor n=1 Tax=Paenibacillus riograndensis SBR5 TaxID=1073571 RepID=A0A0E4CUZ7_9BACL|nr:RNA polymerase ecf-type sigma factor [Paenibacillus riograndensis SBR5]
MILDWIEQAVARVQAGEVEPYAQIVEAYQKPIHRYCSRLLGSRSEAEDAVQDILVKAYLNIAAYRSVASFSSWLYKIAYHHCLDLIRRRKRQQRVLQLFQPAPPPESPEQQMDRNIFSEPLAKALSRLSTEERNLLVLRIFEEQSFPEIAGILDKNMEAVKKKYRRTLMKLAKMMSAHKGGSEWNGKGSLLKKKM